ncbi:MAG: hypothetical protein ACLRMJ_12495 [Alistipes finegoldii]
MRIVVPASGDPAFRLESAGISLYRGYDLRSLMPDAVTLQYDMPFPEAPTSAREAAAGLARQQARLHGASVAVRCDGDGIVRTADNAPLFAVRGKRRSSPRRKPASNRNWACGPSRRQDSNWKSAR